MKSEKSFNCVRNIVLWTLVLTMGLFASLSVSASAVTATGENSSVAALRTSFVLSNDATCVTLSVHDDKQYISRFAVNKYSRTEFITDETEIPVLKSESGNEIQWKFTRFESDESDGKTITLIFDSSDGRLTANCVWQIKPGTGPVEYSCTVDVNSGDRAYFDDALSQLTDFTFDVDRQASVWSYYRMKQHNYEADPDWNRCLQEYPVEAGLDKELTVSNDFRYETGNLPYLMCQLGNDYGFYYGFMWSFGEMDISSADGTSLRLVSGCPETGGTAYADAGDSFNVAGFFLGAYEGDTDDGSNQMKNWFWDYKITDSLRDNENEPQIELDWGSDRSWQESISNQNSWAPYVEKYGLDGIGFEALKYDFEWTTTYGCQQNVRLENTWLANNTDRFPNGMNLYNLVKSYSTKLNFSLYMCNTFNGVDISTKIGQQAEIDALKERFNPNDSGEYGYDYWRSDFDVEKHFSYGSHQGLLNILDEMIEWSKTQDHTFRYEHCSSGGTLKDFTTLERMTFMTTDDSGASINYRMALYNCSYMINPAQLKSDLNISCVAEGNTKQYNYEFRTAMLGASMIAASTQTWERAGMIDAARESWQLYKDKQRPILRNANVYHILDMPRSSRHNNGEDLNNYRDWDGIEYYNDELDKGSVFLFSENINAPDEKNIVLKGLDKNKMYRLTFQERTDQSCVMSGEELMITGIHVWGFYANYESEIIWIEPDETQSANAVELKNAIDKAEKINVNKYSADSVWDLTEKLNSAKKVFADSTSTGYQMWYAVNSLNNTVSALNSDSPYSEIEAEYSASSESFSLRDSVSASQGSCITKAAVGSAVNLGSFDFSFGSGVKSADIAYNLLNGTGAANSAVEIRVDTADGPLLATVATPVNSDGNKDYFSTVSADTRYNDLSGVHDIWLCFTGETSEGHEAVADVDFVKFNSLTGEDAMNYEGKKISDCINAIGSISEDDCFYQAELTELAKQRFDEFFAQYKTSVPVAEAIKLYSLISECDKLLNGLTGDVDENGAVDSSDALLILQYTVGKTGLSDIQLRLADVNGDSAVNSADALKILQLSVGKAL